MLNPNEAPEGYVAVIVTGNRCISACTNCAFDMQTCDDIPCSAKFRQDKTNVYFIKKETKMNQPHIHAELIKAWADGAEIEVFTEYMGAWVKIDRPIWDVDCQYRIKPIPWIPDSINWDHVHTDYKYMAREAHGEVFLFNEKPTINDHYNVWESDGEYVKADAFTSLKVGTIDWKDSLVTRP